MPGLRFATLWLVLAPLLVWAAANPYARVDTEADGDPRALQLAITRFVPAADRSGATVDLIAAIHIADAAYYAELNRRFADYDSLLYELVAPVEGRIPEPDRKSVV